MLIASALNMLTTRRRIDTVISLQTSSAELFLHNSQEAPDSMRIRLSPVFNILPQRQVTPSSTQHREARPQTNSNASSGCTRKARLQTRSSPPPNESSFLSRAGPLPSIMDD
jgi:hypothetical protein